MESLYNPQRTSVFRADLRNCSLPLKGEIRLTYQVVQLAQGPRSSLQLSSLRRKLPGQRREYVALKGGLSLAQPANLPFQPDGFPRRLQPEVDVGQRLRTSPSSGMSLALSTMSGLDFRIAISSRRPTLRPMSFSTASAS